MCICLGVHVCLCPWMRVYLCMHVCVYAGVCSCAHMSVSVCAYASTCASLCVHVSARACVCVEDFICPAWVPRFLLRTLISLHRARRPGQRGDFLLLAPVTGLRDPRLLSWLKLSFFFRTFVSRNAEDIARKDPASGTEANAPGCSLKMSRVLR
jgi:hypothetical protein